jgi:hypothetical protein
MRFLQVLPLALVSFSALAAAAPQNPSDKPDDPPMLGIHWQRGITRPVNAAGGATTQKSKTTSCSDCLTYHGGNVMATTRVVPIFWGTSWNTPSFVQDKITGLTNWYTEYRNSDYEDGTMSEYCSGTGMTGSKTCTAANPTKIQTNSNSGGSGVTFQSTDIATDVTAAVSGSKTANILQEVCKVIQQKVTANNSAFLPSANDYYPVYVDLPVSGGFCAYHSYGTCSYTPPGGTKQSVNIQFGFFWNADGNAGCASGDGPYSVTQNGPSWPISSITQHSEGLGSLVDSTVHELSETRTDPGSPTAWIDSGGAEDGDKCEWNTGYPGQNQSTGIPVVQFATAQWVMQPEWSNAAAIQNGTIAPTSGQFAQQSFSRKGTTSGSYGCVYGSANGPSVIFK